MPRTMCGLLLVLLTISLQAGRVQEDDFATEEEKDNVKEEKESPSEETVPLSEVRRIAEEAVRAALEKERAAREVTEEKEGARAEAKEKKEERKSSLPEDKIILWSSSSQEAYLSLGGYLQPRFEYINNDTNIPKTGTVDVFSLNKARISFSGKLASWAGFKMELDLWDQKIGDLIVSEAYLSLPIVRYFEIRAGLLKAPLSYQRMMSGSKQLFAEESMVSRQRTLSIKGFDPSRKTGAFPTTDFGVLVQGDLFPWPELSVFEKWTKGILRYYAAYQNGYDFKTGSGKNAASMYSVRVEANPFGAKEYNESHWNFDPSHWPVDWNLADMYATLAFNYGKSVDLESAQDIKKDAYWYGVDGIIGMEGLSLSGGWFVLQSAGSKAYENQTVYDPAWESEGFYVQGGLFIPVPYWGIREHVEFKCRYQLFDPYKIMGGHKYDEDDVASFVPQGISKVMDRKTSALTLGVNVYFSLGKMKNALKVSFDYTMRDEKEDFKSTDASVPGSTQVRDDSWILQAQLSL